MGKGYIIRCAACRYRRDLLLGQGDDGFYEFFEESLFLCNACNQLTVVTTPRPYDEICFMREKGFHTPWSEVTREDDDPGERMRQCEDLIAKYLVGHFEEYLCAQCGSEKIEACEEPPTTCPQCACERLEIVDTFEWS